MSQNHRLLRPFVVLVVVVTALIGVTPASAETESRWDGELTVADAVSLSDVPANRWGLTTLDRGSEFFQYYSHAFAITQIGDRLYVGGKFRDVTNGSRTESQPFLAAFDVDTGQWIESFRPSIDWSVFALVPSPNGDRLFVGGEFTTAGGPNTAAFAALDPTTGRIDPTFDVRVTREWSDDAPRIHAMDIQGDWLYLGGAFSHVTGNGERIQSSRAARVSLSTGRPDRAWRPNVAGGSIWEIEASARGDRVYLGGTHLMTQGQVTKGFSVVDAATGQLVPGIPLDYGVTNHTHRGGVEGYVFVATIVEVGDRVFTGGQKHNLVFAERDDMGVLRTHQTNRWTARWGGGDMQAMALAGDVLFVSCHCWGLVHELGTDYYRDARGVLAFDARTGDHLEGYAPEMGGVDGPWALHVADDDCLWIGSDITRSGGVRTNGLIRHCPADGPRTPADRPAPAGPPAVPPAPAPAGPPAVPSGLTAAADNGAAALSWDAVAGARSYLVYRNGAYIGWTTDTSYRDAGVPAGPVQYRLRATNADGRSDRTEPVTVVVQDLAPLTAPTDVVASANGADAVVTWTEVPAARSYLVYRNGAYIGWSASPTLRDVQPPNGTLSYRVRAVNGGDRSPRSEPAELTLRPAGPPAVPTGLTATVDGGEVTLGWTGGEDVRSYLIYRDGGYVGWTAGPSFVDTGVPAGDRVYEIRATNRHGRSDKSAPVSATVR
ncbi:MAG: hypothetical protein AAF547_00465 [Actinomycetota bacterium]